MRHLIGKRCWIGDLTGLIVAVHEAARAVEVFIDGTMRFQTFSLDEIIPIT
jgi:hypothetical protein